MKIEKNKLVELDLSQAFWAKVFTVAPLVVVGSKEGETYNLATKHMAMPMGGGRFFGFVCTPKHSTYHNILANKEFTVSYARPNQLILTSLAAMPRCEEMQNKQQLIDQIDTMKAKEVDALFICDAYFYLECRLHKIYDDFGDFSLISGEIVRAVVHKDSYRASEADEQQLIYDEPLLAYLSPGRFAHIKESFAFPFPLDFQHLVK